MFAIISDIHSNIEALTAVMDDIHSRGIEALPASSAVHRKDVLVHNDPSPSVQRCCVFRRKRQGRALRRLRGLRPGQRYAGE